MSWMSTWAAEALPCSAPRGPGALQETLGSERNALWAGAAEALGETAVGSGTLRPCLGRVLRSSLRAAPPPPQAPPPPSGLGARHGLERLHSPRGPGAGRGSGASQATQVGREGPAQGGPAAL